MDSAIAEIAESRETAFFPSSVHTKETTRQFFENDCRTDLDFAPDADDTQAEFFGECGYRASRFQKFPDLTPITEQVLADHDTDYGSYYLKRFRACRTMAWCVRDVETDMITTRSNSCRLRWCPVCAEARANIIEHSCREFFEKQSSVRFLTLTQKRNDLSLKKQIAQIKKSFAKLRRCSGWRKYVTGCVWFLQIKPSCGGKWWHVHLHILLTGSYMPQNWLSGKWLKVTGDSKIVDIRFVCDLGSALKDVVRYAGRPANLLDVSQKYRLELVHATDKIRVCGTTGICKDVSLRPPKFQKDDSCCENLGSYSTIQRLAVMGDERARDILRAERDGTPLKNAHSFRDVDDFIDDRFSGLSPIEPLSQSRSPPKMDNAIEPDSFWD